MAKQLSWLLTSSFLLAHLRYHHISKRFLT
ncbi:DUF3678 domain-containing protein [Lactiplantibacillus pentosus]|nr:DUF3678 domain-containing protein [Lactiplantibacillus pentosus]